MKGPMRHRIERLLDEVGWRLLSTLQEDARLPFSELGRRVGLSAPAVAERVRRMEEAGIIRGYRVQLGYETLGRPITAMIRINCPEPSAGRVRSLAAQRSEVIECHHLTGTDSFLLKVAVASVGHLEAVIEDFGRHGTPTTAVVLSSPVTNRAITGPPAMRLVRRDGQLDGRSRRPARGATHRSGRAEG